MTHLHPYPPLHPSTPPTHTRTHTHRYVNEPRDALKAFNFARKDTKWGPLAIMHMVEVRRGGEGVQGGREGGEVGGLGREGREGRG